MKRKIGRITAATMALLCLGVILILPPETETEDHNGFRAQDMIVPLPRTEHKATPTPTPIPTLTPQQIFHSNLTDVFENEEITITAIEYEYIGTYFVTAYCPYECGYTGDNYPKGWMTASGEICHRSDYEDRLYQPTTCAIDRRYHSFGDMFYIEEFDRVFIAEDTGAFSGRWLDLFYEDYEDVLSFPTGYYTVYSVQYVTKTIKAKEATT